MSDENDNKDNEVTIYDYDTDGHLVEDGIPDDAEFIGTFDATPYLPDDFFDRDLEWQAGYMAALFNLCMAGILPMEEQKH